MKGKVTVGQFGPDLDVEIDKIINEQPYKRRDWSEKELYILRRMYNKTSNVNIKKLIPNRSLKGIQLKAFDLGIQRRMGKNGDGSGDEQPPPTEEN